MAQGHHYNLTLQNVPIVEDVTFVQLVDKF